MRKFTMMLAALGVATAAIPVAANAAPWQSINQRQANLNARINQGVRTGALTRNEAFQLRVQFNNLVKLEARYRYSRPGLTFVERRDLDRRFDALSRQVYAQKHDRQTVAYRGTPYRR